ncbi:ectonucleotide pyrophosphatase/phosphodiesterase family member 1 isoform X2 [Hippocampus zosterae]|uniref:ectonucleotide pyrophosphatase/phosphodiesterase family member 1 isoform X2 n=1 Tax=Hippocampus zosterae TaxID=109293 RepID=UPI00223D0485|nr:ectonucleotide pyrophosphatase/phosphodiesterase family member 1 isoform X2 [Hippocampus zosterae]
MQSGGRRPPSSLTASTSSPSFSPGLACAMKAAPNKRKLILLVCVLSVSLVTLILGLGLGLGLELRRCRDRVGPRTSCRNRCYQPYDGDTPGCRCDDACGDSGTCCPDYHDLCKAPAELWECTRLRCGETRLPTSRCHCSDDCSANFDCCSNYRHVCQGQSQWVEDECEDLSRPSCPPGFKRQPLLLVSLDGLRADYLRLWNPLIPVLAKLQKCGASASYMQSSFPTKTFPNHYSIVTGLYPESNGLIDNVMYDPVMDAIFTLSGPEKENPEWYLGQPIWHTAKYQGLKSGTFFWPGSDVKINGSFPDIYRPYNGKIPFEERVLTVLKWLQLPDGQRPDFYTLYLEEPDKSGHSFGPVSGGVAQSIKAVDKVVGQLMNGLKQLGLHRCVNVIVVADHGMEETSCDRKENLQELLGDVSDYIATEGPFGRIRAKNPGADLQRCDAEPAAVPEVAPAQTASLRQQPSHRRRQRAGGAKMAAGEASGVAAVLLRRPARLRQRCGQHARHVCRPRSKVCLRHGSGTLRQRRALQPHVRRAADLAGRQQRDARQPEPPAATAFLHPAGPARAERARRVPPWHVAAARPSGLFLSPHERRRRHGRQPSPQHDVRSRGRGATETPDVRPASLAAAPGALLHPPPGGVRQRLQRRPEDGAVELLQRGHAEQLGAAAARRRRLPAGRRPNSSGRQSSLRRLRRLPPGLPVPARYASSDGGATRRLAQQPLGAHVPRVPQDLGLLPRHPAQEIRGRLQRRQRADGPRL